MITLTLALKAIGSAALFASAAGFSAMNKKSDAERIVRLEGQIRFVRFVRDRIDRYLSPVSDILRECDASVISDLLTGCAEADFGDIEGLRAVLRSGRYFADGGARFDSFLSALGSSYRETELLECDECLRELSELCARLAKELPKERKSKSVLFFCFAAAVVIILI